MLHRRLWLTASIIAIAVIGGFVLSVPHTREAGAPLRASEGQGGTPSVAFTDVFKKGVRTISGTVVAPDACSTLHAGSSLQGDASTTEKIIVSLDMPPSSGICLKVPTAVTFSTSLAASQALPLEIHINGALATTTAP